METIKNYLESMFRNLPQTEKVLRAKSELLQMMEDKYTELIKEGKSENETVGTVISEFGNLEDLAEDLGIADVFESAKTANVTRRKVSFDEITDFIKAKTKAAYLTAAGIFLCITSVTGPIVTDALPLPEAAGVVLMFLMVGLGVLCFILHSVRLNEYRYITSEPCSIDTVTQDFVKNKRREYTTTYSIMLSIGVLLCILCITPPILLENIDVLEELSAVFLFLFVGTGVFLIVSSSIIKKTYEQILEINGNIPFSKKEPVNYKNTKVKAVMSVFWPTITCIYLCVSFLTHRWDISWLIWPISGVISALITVIFGEQKEEK